MIVAVPAHLQVLRAHQSRFGLRAGEEGLGFRIERHATHTGTVRICLAGGDCEGDGSTGGVGGVRAPEG